MRMRLKGLNFTTKKLANGTIKKYWYAQEVQTVFDALIEASHYFEYRRWPEVYCGVSKSIGGVLARQPDASRPQAWSAGVIFYMLQTILGIAPNPFSTRVDVTPALPSNLDEVSVENLSILGATLSIRLIRDGAAVLMDIKDNPDNLDIVIHPPTRNHRQRALEEGPAVSG